MRVEQAVRRASPDLNSVNLLLESFSGSRHKQRRDFISELDQLRKHSETDYHQALLNYFPKAEKKPAPHSSLAQTRGVWYSDSHLLCRRSNAAPLLHALHSALPRCSYSVSVGDEWDFGWSELSNPISKAVDYKVRIAQRYPHCIFYTITGNHDGSQEYIDALRMASKENSNIVVQPYALKLGRTLFTHGDCVGMKNPTVEQIDKYRDSFNNGWKPNLLEKFIDHFYLKTGIIPHLTCNFLELFLPKHRQAERVLRFVNELDPGLLDGTRNICFGHTHKAFRGFDYQGYRFFNGGAHEHGFKPALHRFLVKGSELGISIPNRKKETVTA